MILSFASIKQLLVWVMKSNIMVWGQERLRLTMIDLGGGNNTQHRRAEPTLPQNVFFIGQSLSLSPSLLSSISFCLFSTFKGLADWNTRVCSEGCGHHVARQQGERSFLFAFHENIRTINSPLGTILTRSYHTQTGCMLKSQKVLILFSAK